jgi:hypothetical protein
MSIRTIKVLGTAVPGTVINVTVDGIPADTLIDSALYSFTTSTKFHGKQTVRIKVTEGSITFGEITATYPALLNDSVGYATFIQPIENPMVTFTDQLNYVPKALTLTAPSEFEYDHLMLNGVTRLCIITTQDVQQGDELYIGDIRTGQIPQYVVSITPEYDYSYLPNQFNQTDLDKLLSTIYPTYK